MSGRHTKHRRRTRRARIRNGEVTKAHRVVQSAPRVVAFIHKEQRKFIITVQWADMNLYQRIMESGIYFETWDDAYRFWKDDAAIMMVKLSTRLTGENNV